MDETSNNIEKHSTEPAEHPSITVYKGTTKGTERLAGRGNEGKGEGDITRQAWREDLGDDGSEETRGKESRSS